MSSTGLEWTNVKKKNNFLMTANKSIFIESKKSTKLVTFYSGFKEKNAFRVFMRIDKAFRESKLIDSAHLGSVCSYFVHLCY